MRLRTYEKYMLAAAGVLTLALVVILVAPARWGGFELGWTDPLSERDETAVAQGAPEAEAGGNMEEEGGTGPLCAAHTLLYAHNDRFAVVADAEGRFAFYGAPDGRTGERSQNSYDLLRDCYPGGPYYPNYASVRIAEPGAMTSSYGGSYAEGSGEVRLADAENAASLEPTTRGDDGSLTTRWRFEDGISLTQTLRLVEGPRSGAADTLEIVYEVENTSSSPKSVGVRSHLTPPLAGERRPLFYVPALEGRPLAEGGGAEIANERVLFSRTGQVHPFSVPRAGAASDASGLWSPGSEGPGPDRITFADPARLFEWSFIYDIRPGWPLGEEPAFAVYWLDKEVGPGQKIRFSHSYGAAPQEAAPAR